MENRFWQDWKLGDKVGEGSFGVVYKARNKRGDIVAIKHISLPRSSKEVELLLKNKIITDKEQSNNYFAGVIRKEIEIMRKFNGNPYIIDYYDLIQENNGDKIDFYIKMEYVEDIVKKFNDKAFDVNEVIKLGIDICSALELCHSIDVIHNDIKPQNIFIGQDGKYKLGDFNISIKDNEVLHNILATPNYVSPEVYKNEQITFSTDLYSLGLVMYKLLNGNLPFVNKFNDDKKAFEVRMSGKKVPKINDIDERIMKIISKACEFDSRNRYLNATEMKYDLEKIKSTLFVGEVKVEFAESTYDETLDIYEVDVVDGKDTDLAVKTNFFDQLKNSFYDRRKIKKMATILAISCIVLISFGAYMLNRGCKDGYINRGGFCVKGYYYCASGYTLNSENKCQKTLESIDAKVTYSCKKGYTLSGEICVSTDIKEPKQVYKCADGFTLNGTKCEREESADALVTYTCPSGYVSVGDQCMTVASVDAVQDGYTCDDSSYTLSGTICKKTDTKVTLASKSYSCNSGGTLNGTICTYTTSPSTQIGWIPQCSQGKYNYMSRLCEYTADANVKYTCSTGTSDGKGNCITTTTLTKAAIAKYSCPDGYSSVGGKCAKTTGIKGTVKYICGDSAELRGKKCYTTISTDAVSAFDCGEGYIASATGCYKDDFPSAVKKYTCSRVYTLNGSKCEKYKIIDAKAYYSD